MAGVRGLVKQVRRYLREVGEHGFRWFWRVAGVLGVVGGVTLLGALTDVVSIDPLAVVAIFLLVVLLMFVVGSYRAWSSAVERAENAEKRTANVTAELAIEQAQPRGGVHIGTLHATNTGRDIVHFAAASEAAPTGPLKVVHGRTFNPGEHLTLDGYHYVGCHFDRCVMEYSGGDFRADDCTGVDISVNFGGPAARTVQLLQFLEAATGGPGLPEGGGE